MIFITKKKGKTNDFTFCDSLNSNRTRVNSIDIIHKVTELTNKNHKLTNKNRQLDQSRNKSIYSKDHC